MPECSDASCEVYCMMTINISAIIATYISGFCSLNIASHYSVILCIWFCIVHLVCVALLSSASRTVNRLFNSEIPFSLRLAECASCNSRDTPICLRLKEAENLRRFSGPFSGANLPTLYKSPPRDNALPCHMRKKYYIKKVRCWEWTRRKSFNGLYISVS